MHIAFMLPLCIIVMNFQTLTFVYYGTTNFFNSLSESVQKLLNLLNSSFNTVIIICMFTPHYILSSNCILDISSVLRDPWERVSQNDSLFIQLEQAITVFLKEVSCS